ncbi:MAG TPA: hypothetical protein VH371_10525 [Candidatus Limnocylindrales bacterium]|jgi:hypothetical protein
MRFLSRVSAGVVLALALLTMAASPSLGAAWSGRFSVYTKGSFSYQHLNYTCVGASVQMMLNMVDGTTKHSATAQKNYWQYGRDHSKHKPGNNGVDPVGWVAALEHFGAGDYAVNVAPRFQAGLQTLAAAMRATDRPVGLFVDAGGHAWVMTGFESTADPATASSFKVTAVQAMGPLYPDGTINGHPYDPGPGTWLSLDQLRKKFTPMKWKIAPEWSGRWIAVIPD